MSPDSRQRPEKVLLLIRSLHVGGAERQVVALAKSMSALGTTVHVAVKVAGGPLEGDLQGEPSVRLHFLGSPGTAGTIRYLLRLRTLLKSNRFDAVYGFMPVPNLALLVARTIRRRPVITWGVRSSDVDQGQYGARVKWTMRLEKWLSKFSDRIITNSHAALAEYRRNGYPHSKLSHVPNAIDVDRFKPDPDARAAVDAELGLDSGAPLIGLFARIHPMKDHRTFLGAAKIFLDEIPDARFICAGDVSSGFSAYNKEIRSNATGLNLDERVLWLGLRTDPQKLMAACDITTLTSNSGEGFPNSVAESLACGTPCVTVDVGDAAKIVDDPGGVVSRSNPKALAEAWLRQFRKLENADGRIGEQLRKSIIDRYSPTNIASATLELLAR